MIADDRISRATTRRAIAFIASVSAAAALSAIVSPVPQSAAAELGNGDERGNVALTWAPTYMSNDHEYTRAQAEMMAKKFDLVAAMPMAFRNHSTRMRVLNPNLILLSYANSTMSSPQLASGLPEAAYAHDVNGNRIMIPEFDNYLMQASNDTWRQFADQVCDDRVARGGYDGCLMDNLALGIFTPGYATALPVKPRTKSVYTEAEYRAMLIDIAAYFNRVSPSILHVGNSAQNQYRYWRAPVSSQPSVKSQPAAQMEDFIRGARTSANEFPLNDEWLRNVDAVRDFEAGTTVGLFTTKLWSPATPAQVARWQKFAMASFLMGADGDSYFAFTASRDKAGAMGTNAPYTMPKDLGLPRGPMLRHSTGAYFRSFGNGVSLVNPTTSTVTVDLGTTMKNLAGQSVSSVTLPSGTGEVLTGAPALQASATDTTSPWLSNDVPTPTSTELTWSGRAFDNAKVSSVSLTVRNERTKQYLRRDGTWGSAQELPATLTSAGAPTTTFSKSFSLEPGLYGFTVKVLDAAGNRTPANFQTVELKPPSDTTGPTVTMGDPALDLGRTSFSGTATDNTSVASVKLWIRDEATGLYLRRDGTWGASQTLPAQLDQPGAATTPWSYGATLPPGSYGVTVRATDAAGNVGPSIFKSVTIP